MIKYRCPAWATKVGRTSIHCSYDTNCSKSAYGRTFYIYPKSNYRLFISISRRSYSWQAHLTRRASVERLHKQAKLDFSLMYTRITCKRRFLSSLLLFSHCAVLPLLYSSFCFQCTFFDWFISVKILSLTSNFREVSVKVI